jgi:CPA2 family monovalent cation:H+ antiporter-2
MIGITLVEDLAVVVLIVLMPALGRLTPERLAELGLALLRAGAILVPFWVLAVRVMPRALTWVARTRNPELFLLVALAIALGTAALTQAVGLSLALGAFLAGLLVNQTEYGHETLARVLSLRDAFVALFFVTLGALIDPAVLLASLPLLGVMVALVLVGKLVLWTGVVALFGYPPATAVLVGLGFTQIGEFSFLLVQAARRAGHVGNDVYNATLATALLTILANAALVRLGPRWLERLSLARAARTASVPGEDGEAPRVVLCGFGRVGSAIGGALETFGLPYLAIETDPDIVRGLRSRGVPALYGDAAHPHLLDVAGVTRAPLVIVTLPDADHARLVIERARGLNRTVPILARAHRARAHEALREAGATVVVEPEVEAAAALIRHALRRLTLSEEKLTAYLDRFHDAMSLTTPAPGPAGLPEVRDITLPAGELTGLTLRSASVRERFGVTVVGILPRDGVAVVNPPAETVLRAGDRLRVFGLPGQIESMLTAAAAPGGARTPGDPGEHA